MITRRDLLITTLALSIGITVGHAATADVHPPIMQSTLFDWSALSASPTGVGQFRNIMRGPTATLDELEMHATTLNPGQMSHPPHQHPNEEVVILQSGELEAFSNGKTQRLGPGSVIFNASNQLHSVKNVGTTPAVYHVINWTTPATARMKAAAAAANPSAPAAPATPSAASAPGMTPIMK
jgi:XRE family transcriptional regulator, regulator of sulfur utilization